MTNILNNILIIAGVAVLFGAFTYNRFVTLKNRTREAWADIDVQLKRRYDLIPNLMETVKGYMTHEREVLENVVKARSLAISGGNISAQSKAEDALSGALKSLFALSENYPNLKANENFVELQRELSDTENKIQAARRFYNTNIRDFNTKIESFPSNIIAGIFSF